MPSVPDQVSNGRPPRSSPLKKARYDMQSVGMKSRSLGVHRAGMVDAPPGAGIEVHLVQHKAIRIAGVQRNAFGAVRMPIHDVAGAAIPKIFFQAGVRSVRIDVRAAEPL